MSVKIVVIAPDAVFILKDPTAEGAERALGQQLLRWVNSVQYLPLLLFYAGEQDLLRAGRLDPEKS